MQKRTLTGTTLDVGRLVLGTMTFGGQVDEAEAEEMVRMAIDAGVTMVDTANVYTGGESETMLGRLLAPVRDEVQIATKVGSRAGRAGGTGGLSSRAVVESVDESLRRLRTDRIDLLYLHMPDPTTPIEETLETVEDLIASGKIRHAGHSNYAAWQVAEMVFLKPQIPGIRVAQQQYNLVSRLLEDEYTSCSRRFDLSTVVYNPLAGGLLTGKHSPGETPTEGRFSQAGYRSRYWHGQMFEAVDRLAGIAVAHDLTIVELAYRWLLAQPLVTCVIVGASSPSQLATNLGAAEGPPLDSTALELIDGVWDELRGPAPRYNR